MNIAILTFTKDKASMTQRAALLPFFSKTHLLFDSYEVFTRSSENQLYLFQTDQESVYYEHIDKALHAQTQLKFDLLIFCTKHDSKSTIPSLCCHTQGNFGQAEYGSKDYTVAPCVAHIQSSFFEYMKKITP